MATIERRDLPPPVETTITEADRDKVYGIIAKQLADTLTGDQSYYPEGQQKDAAVRAADLDKFIETLTSMQGVVSDPSNILGSVIDELNQHALDFHVRVDRKSAPIELPPEFSPTTRDNRVIQVDPFPGPFSPPNPLAPRNWPKDSYTSFDANGAPAGARPSENALLFSRKPSLGSAADNSLQSAALPQRAVGPPGLYSGRPMRQCIVPPLCGRR